MKLNKTEIKRTINKIKDFSTKFPLMKQEDINKKELAKAIGENYIAVEMVFWLMNQQQKEGIYLEDVEKIVREKEKIKIYFKNGEKNEYEK